MKVKTEEIIVPEVDKKILHSLKRDLKFSDASCTRALYYTGNCSYYDSVAWLHEHCEDANFLEYPLVTVSVPRGYLCDRCQELYRTRDLKLYESRSALVKHVKETHSKGSSPYAVCGIEDCSTVVERRCLASHQHIRD